MDHLLLEKIFTQEKQEKIKLFQAISISVTKDTILWATFNL